MSRTAKIALIAAAIVVGTFLIGSLAAAAAIYHEGSISVFVQEKGEGGQRVHVVVPAALVRAALIFVPDSAFDEARGNIRSWGPALKGMSASLADCPDGTFVHVQDGKERVIVAKRGNALVVDVDSPEESVKVSLPLGTMTALIHRLAPEA